jgi:hypothetical protein
MQASIERIRDGSIDVHLDPDAARAVFASVLFATRFHEGFAPLAPFAEEGLLGVEPRATQRGSAPCQ